MARGHRQTPFGIETERRSTLEHDKTPLSPIQSAGEMCESLSTTFLHFFALYQDFLTSQVFFGFFFNEINDLEANFGSKCEKNMKKMKHLA